MRAYVTMWVVTLCALFAWSSVSAQGNFRIGRGIADMTGLVSEGATYGYADPNLDARGLQLRQYCRSFVLEAGGNRVAISVVDMSLISQALHDYVMDALANMFGGLYTAENVMLTAQHSHSTPGGFNAYFMYMVPNGGWINETSQAYVDGIVQSIQRAHNDLQDGDIYYNSGELLDANVNRAGYSYDQNPEEERARYAHNVDKEMSVLKLVDAVGGDLGMINLFSVHTTSMTNLNHIVSTDNKGYAAQLFERDMNPGAFPGQGAFVAAFGQSAEGDSVPDIQGTFCNYTDVECSYNTSQCAEDPENPKMCRGRGPAGEQFEDTRIIGERQYVKAMDLYTNASELISGPVDYRFTWVNMSAVVADIEGQMEELCAPAMGYSFAAGGTNGPGAAPFNQGMLEGIPELDELIERIWDPPASLTSCHEPKPILLPTAVIENPWTWQPSVLPLQLFRIGDLVLIGFPAEIATMAGRRLQDAVRSELIAQGFPPTTRVLIVGITNLYSSYVVTKEEYQVQRYEGASTIFGQYTLDGYLQEFVSLATALATGAPVDIGEHPEDLRGNPEPGLEPTLPDGLDPGQSFGDVLVDALDQYQTGEVAYAIFVSGNPRNDLRTDDTFLAVEKQEPDLSWTTVFSDSHWDTKFIWTSNCQERPPVCILPNITGCTPFNISDYLCREETFSNATIEWEIPANQEPGTYRLLHYGNSRDRSHVVTSYMGVSRTFQVTTATGPVTKRHSKEYYTATGEGERFDEKPGNLLEFLQHYLVDGLYDY